MGEVGGWSGAGGLVDGEICLFLFCSCIVLFLVMVEVE